MKLVSLEIGCGWVDVLAHLDVHVVGRKDQFEKDLLLNIDKVGIPLLDDLAHDGRAEGLLDLAHLLSLVLFTELNHLREDNGLHVGKGDLLLLLIVLILWKNWKVGENDNCGDGMEWHGVEGGKWAG